MAGFKQTLIDHGAVALYSFDGDQFDPVTRKLIVPDGFPKEIIDEIGNNNPAILHSDHEVYLGYRLGMPSMTDLEPTDQYSISFGYYGEIPDHPDDYPKSYMEIPHSSAFSFEDGSFSFAFQMIKENETISGLTTADRVIIWKSGVFKVWIDFSSGAEYLYYSHPGGTMTIRWDYADFFKTTLGGKYLYCVFTWELIDLGGGYYEAYARAYFNSLLMGEQRYEYIDTPPNTNVATAIYIGGDPTSSDIDEDRHTTACRMDNISFYETGLTAQEVSTQWRKIFAYREMIINEHPENYWRLADVDSLSDKTAYDEMGDQDGEYIGTRNVQFIREQTGPVNIVDSKSVRFADGGMVQMMWTSGSYTIYPRAIDEDYTYEFWFKTPQTLQGILFSMQEASWPFDGLLVEMNMQDRSHNVGYLQFSERRSEFVFNSLLNAYTDDNWHHVALVRNGTLVQFYIDASLQHEEFLSTKYMADYGQMFFMNVLPGQNQLAGSLSEIVYYDYPLSEWQISSRYNYQTTYRVRGVVTLLGTPYQATIRFYDLFTGELLQSLQSDPITGEYTAWFRNNRQVNMVVFDANDSSVRYRAYGPITPSETEDLPVLI